MSFSLKNKRGTTLVGMETLPFLDNKKEEEGFASPSGLMLVVP